MPSRILTSRANQFADEPESEEMIARSGSRSESSQKRRWGLSGCADCIARASISFHQLVDAALDPLAPRSIALALEQRDQLPQGPGGVADQVDLHRVADPDHPRVEVDLDAAGLALLGQEL